MIRHYRNDNKRRYYTAHLAQDLLGDWVLIKAWGSLDNGLGRIDQQLVTSYEDGQTQLDAIEERRRKRQYHRINA